MNKDFFGILVPFIGYVMAVIGYLASLATYRYGNCTLISKDIVVCSDLTDVSASYFGKEIKAFCLLRKGQLLEYLYEQVIILVFFNFTHLQLSSIHFFGFQVAVVIWGKMHMHAYPFYVSIQVQHGYCTLLYLL